ncbi:MAG: thiamine-phosphate kinase [Terricaulis sp.]
MSADEFDIIRTLFAPLAASPEARGLIDDVAVLEARGKVIVTTDAIVEGVHFFPDDPIGTVAMKALRVNLSDLAAKGAICTGALLTLAWPNDRPSHQLAEFARGLAEDLTLYEIPLLGGDTTSTSGPLVVSITAFGASLAQRVPSRADAKVGDDVWVSGTIGDGWVGLEALKAASATRLLRAEFAHAIARYRVPQPRVMNRIIQDFAAASMDISDGLIQDAAKLAAASQVRLRIVADDVPLSSDTRRWLARGGHDALAPLSGGDDYEILFTAASAHRDAIAAAAATLAFGVTRIGAVEAGEGLVLTDRHGAELKSAARGYTHKLGS